MLRIIPISALVLLPAMAMAADEPRCTVPSQNRSFDTIGEFNKTNKMELGNPGQNRLGLSPSQFAQLRNFTRDTFCNNPGEMKDREGPM